MQKYANLVELDKCCQTHIFLQSFVLIQPRTSPPKICRIFEKRPEASVNARRYDLGRYEKLAYIGVGAYGSVFLAKDVQTGQAVALKKLKDKLNSEAQQKKDGFPKQLLREMKILRRTKHDNVAESGRGNGRAELRALTRKQHCWRNSKSRANCPLAARRGSVGVGFLTARQRGRGVFDGAAAWA